MQLERDNVPYNFTASKVASELRDELPDLVTIAKRTASPDEHELVELAGQVVHFAVEDTDDEHLVEMQAYGSCLPSTGEQTFFVSVRSRPIRSRPTAEAKTAEEPWTPEQGPMTRKSAAKKSTKKSAAKKD